MEYGLTKEMGYIAKKQKGLLSGELYVLYYCWSDLCQVIDTAMMQTYLN